MNNKKIIIFIFLLVLVFTSGTFFYVATLNNKNEIEKINKNLVINYTKEKFISKILEDNNIIIHKNKIKNHLLDNYNNFKNKSDVEKVLNDYIELYNSSFKILDYFKKISYMKIKDYGEIRKYLLDFKFDLVLARLSFLNTKNNSADIEALKKYFNAVVSELDFNSVDAEKLYREAININRYDINFYIRYSNFLYNNGKFDDGIILIENSLKNFVLLSQRDSAKKLNLLLNLAKFYYLSENYNKAFEKFNSLLIQSLNYNNDNYKMLAIYNIALLETKNANYVDAIENFVYSFRLATKLNNNQYMIKSLNNLSHVNLALNKYDDGEFYGIKAMMKAKEIDDIKIIGESSYNVCLIFNAQQEQDIAEIYCNLADTINKKLKDTIF